MKKGISLLSLFITILIISILATTATITGIDVVSNARLSKFASELSEVQNLVDSYKEANLGEYPVSDIAVIDISGVTDLGKVQFADETKVNGNKINLFAIDMSLLSKTDLAYGNNETYNDIYVVSKETGKVYYAQGFKEGGKVYYTLTSELLELIGYDKSIKAVNKDGILFYSSNTNWTNQAINVVIQVPDNSDYKSITVSTKSGTSTLSNVSLSSTKNGYKLYNINNLDRNCDIVVNYSKTDVGNTSQIFQVTNIDKTAPTLNVEKQEGFVNNADDDKKIYVKVNPTDNQSGIAFTKYEVDDIDESLLKDYFITNGIAVKDNAITVDRLTKTITIYTEDNAGNGAFRKVELTPKVVSEKDYVQDGLILHYDGINNTGNGHSTTTSTWKNLASTNYDGSLRSFALNTSSGWVDNALKFDGVDDWVFIGQLNPQKLTVEVVASFDKLDTEEIFLIGCVQNGGYGMYKPKNSIDIGWEPYIDEINDYSRIKFYDVMQVNTKFSCSGVYDNKKNVFYYNGERVEKDVPGTIREPENGTVLVLGNNPSGQVVSSGIFFNGKVYSVRVYNRALSNEEVMQNYRIDKIRFGVD